MTTSDEDRTRAEAQETEDDRPDATDELAHRREVTRLAASVVEHGAHVFRNLDALREVGLSTEGSMREVWRFLPTGFAARIPEVEFAQIASMLTNAATAIQQGGEETLNFYQQIVAKMGQDSGRDPLSAGFMAGHDYVVQQDVVRAELRDHNDRGRLRSFVQRTIGTSAVALACRVMLRSGGSFDGLLSETPDGLLELEQAQEVQDPGTVTENETDRTCCLFFPYTELSSIVFAVKATDG